MYKPLILLIILVLGAFGIIFIKDKKSKADGIIALVVALLVIILRFVLPNTKIYTLIGPEYKKADAMASKVLDPVLVAYNENDIDTLSSYFTEKGAPIMREAFEDIRETYGDYKFRGEGEAYHALGLYFVAYPTKMDKVSQGAYLVASFKKSKGKTLLNTLELLKEEPNFFGE